MRSIMPGLPSAKRTARTIYRLRTGFKRVRVGQAGRPPEVRNRLEAPFGHSAPSRDRGERRYSEGQGIRPHYKPPASVLDCGEIEPTDSANATRPREYSPRDQKYL